MSESQKALEDSQKSVDRPSTPAVAPQESMKWLRLNAVDSTMSEARRRLAFGSDDVSVIIARTQHGGMGRSGRRWESPDGGLWMTLMTPMSLQPLVGIMALRVGLAVCETVEQVLGAGASARVRIKWPNDVLINGRKACGVLCEAARCPKGVPWLLAGVGMNVNNPSSALGTGLRRPAISLSEALGAPLDLEPLSDRLARRTIERLRSVPDVETLGAIAARLWRMDETIEVRAHDGEVVRGVLRGLNAEGRLVLDVEGTRRIVPHSCEILDEPASEEPTP